MPGSPPIRQRVSFCTSPDGTRIAIAAVGSGPPLLRAAHWLSHVEHDASSPVWRPWLDALARRHTYIRYDQRGCGLSDAQVEDFSLEAWVADLEAVADHLQLRRFPLLGMSQGGAVAIAYAVRHPCWTSGCSRCRQRAGCASSRALRSASKGDLLRRTPRLPAHRSTNVESARQHHRLPGHRRRPCRAVSARLLQHGRRLAPGAAPARPRAAPGDQQPVRLRRYSRHPYA
ncbi:MAG: alpha/beta fold hydrolase, partial [Ramlibacter sp.]